jgi:hypothetical protein
MGGIAVLSILHAQWLKSQEELSTWCSDQVCRVLQLPAQESPLDVPESITDTHWQGFVGEMLVFELADAPHDKSVRALCFQFAASNRYATTAIMFRRAFLLRSRLGAEFDRFVNLVVFIAGLWHVLNTCRGWQIKSKYPSKAWQRLCRAFVDEQIPASPLDWSTIAAFAVTRVVRVQRIRFPEIRLPIHIQQHPDERHIRRNDPGFDIQFLKYVFSELPSFDRLWSLGERQQFLRVTHELVSVSIRMLPSLRANEEVDGTPFPYDDCVFELVARTIARLEDSGIASELWKPILTLGPKYHYWVDSFLAKWMIYGVSAANSRDGFVACWREMLSFTLLQPDWSRGWHADDLAIEICGLNYGLTSIGDKDEFAPLLQEMTPLFAQAATKWFQHIRVAQQFARFLSHSAARPLIPSGLRWLWNSVRKLNDRAWGSGEQIESDLISALRAAWQHCSETITQDEKVRHAFLGILNALTSRQNHAAIALRDRILSAFRS